MENNVNNAEELFLNVRKSIRLLYDYQHRVQGTMFYIKMRLNLSTSKRASNRIEINKLFSNPIHGSNNYGQFQLHSGNWAWDFLFPIAMEYYLGERETVDNNHRYRLSVIVVTDDGFFKAIKKDPDAKKEKTETFADVGSSDTAVLFVMELKQAGEWAKQWKRDYMESSLEKWLNDDQDTISDKTKAGNDFIVMKFNLSELVTKDNIDHVLNEISNRIKNITGYTVY